MSFSSSSPVLESKRKRKKPSGTSPESSSKRQRESAIAPTTPKQKQLSLDTFFAKHQSSPLSNIVNSLRPREQISARNVNRSPQVVTIDDSTDDCQVVERKVPQPSQSGGKRRLGENELVNAARLVVNGFYGPAADEDDPEIIADDGSKHTIMCEGYALLFHKEIRESHYKFALLLLAANVTWSQYPGAAVLHSVLQNIIPRSETFDVKALALDILYEVLEKHPPDGDEMKDVYWSILPSKFANTDPSSRWENLRTHLENLDNDAGSLEIADLSDPCLSFNDDEALLQYYITVLEKEFRNWLERCSAPMAAKNLPMVAQVLWPYEPLGTQSSNVKELVLLHKNALVRQNQRLMSVTSRLLDIVIKVTRVSENPPPVKIRVAGPKLRSLAGAVSDVFLRGGDSVDLSSLFDSFDDSLFKLELSKALLDIYEPRRGKLSTLSEVLRVYLKLDEVKGHSDLTVSYEKLSRRGQICLAALVESYLKSFHVDKLWNLICKSKTTSGFEAGAAGGDKYFSSSYNATDLVKDFRALQSVVKLAKGSKVISSVFHM